MRQIIAKSLRDAGVKLLLFGGVGVVAFLLGLDKNPVSAATNSDTDLSALAAGEQCQSVSASEGDSSQEEVLFVGCGGFF
jgi:hypothetical protein